MYPADGRIRTPFYANFSDSFLFRTLTRYLYQFHARHAHVPQKLVSQIDNFHEARADFNNNVFRDEKRGGVGKRDAIRRRKRQWRCVIKLRIVRGELIVLAARFSRSQRDNCSILPLICETPRELPRLLAARRVVERQRERKRERCIRDSRCIYGCLLSISLF